MNYTIGIDIGTTAVKAVMTALGGERLDGYSARYPIYRAEQGAARLAQRRMNTAAVHAIERNAQEGDEDEDATGQFQYVDRATDIRSQDRRPVDCRLRGV